MSWVSLEADADADAEDGSQTKARPKCYIDPYDSIEVFYTPAIRRIHQGICNSDPSSRARCGMLSSFHQDVPQVDGSANCV